MYFTLKARRAGLMMAVGFGLLACKLSNSGGDKKSIEAVATGDQALRGNMTCGPGSLPNETSVDALIRSYHALPELLRGVFSTEGSYEIVNDPTSVCLDGLSGEKYIGNDVEKRLVGDSRLKGLKSCWKTSAVEEGYPTPKIILGNDRQAVHNALLTTSFYAFAEWYLDRIAGPALDKVRADKGTLPASGDGKSLVEIVDSFRAARSSLASAVLEDLSAAGKSDVIAKYEQDFNQPVVALASDVSFQNFVSAEFTDTWYCSVGTRRSIADSELFVKSRKAYEQMAMILGKAWFEEK